MRVVKSRVTVQGWTAVHKSNFKHWTNPIFLSVIVLISKWVATCSVKIGHTLSCPDAYLYYCAVLLLLTYPA